MANILSDAKKQQVIALGQLGWTLRRIEAATGVRRETAGAYLKAAGLAVRPPGRWGHPPANPAKEVSTDPNPPAAAQSAPPDPIGFAGGDVNLYAYVGNRPTAATDPLGLWKPWAHRQVTREVADECGLSAKRNAKLAENANTGMDKHPSALSPSSPAHTMPDSPWRQYVATKLSQAVAQDAAGDQDGAMKSLGQGLHAVQDAWAHDLRRPQGT